jgi:transcriptional regulator with XRE-family HTH domain
MDHSALYGRMKQMGITQKSLADMLGINANTLHLKLRGQYPFKATEIAIISGTLGIAQDEIGRYFFQPVVEKSQLLDRKEDGHHGET